MLISAGASKCCSKLNITSTGLASKVQPLILGLYGHYSITSENTNVFKQIEKSHFLYEHPSEGWGVRRNLKFYTNMT